MIMQDISMKSESNVALRDGQLAAGFTSVALFVTNAAMTPSTATEGGVGNTWVS